MESGAGSAQPSSRIALRMREFPPSAAVGKRIRHAAVDDVARCQSRPRPVRGVTKGASKEAIAVETHGSPGCKVWRTTGSESPVCRSQAASSTFFSSTVISHALTKMFSPGGCNKFQPLVEPAVECAIPPVGISNVLHQNPKIVVDSRLLLSIRPLP